MSTLVRAGGNSSAISALQPKLLDRGLWTANTTYAVGDLVVVNGMRYAVRTAYTSTTFASTTNLMPIGASRAHEVFAYDYGARGDGTTDSGPAIQAAIDAAAGVVASPGLGIVRLPQGFVQTGQTIVLKNHVWLVGAGMFGTVLRANGAVTPPLNGPVVRSARSGTDASNAFYCGVMDMSIDGRKAAQTATTGCHGIHFETNPLGTGAGGDEEFDTHHIIARVRVYFCKNDGIYLRGRSAIMLDQVLCRANDGYGLNTTFDTMVAQADLDGNGLAGWIVQNGSVRGDNVKCYLNGTVDPTSPGLLATSNCTGLELVGFEAQNNKAEGIRLTGSRGCNIHATLDANNTSNSGYAGITLDGATDNILTVAARDTPQGGTRIGFQNNAAHLVNGADRNHLTLTHFGTGSVTVGSALSAGSVVLTNRIVVNAQQINPVYENTAVRGQANGYATLGADGLVPSGQLPAASGGTPLFFGNGFFGDGSDGSATLDGTTTPSWTTRSGSTYSLTRNVNLDTLTINSGVTLRTTSFLLNAKTAISGSGTILYSGTAATSATGGGAAVGNYLAGGAAGGGGATGAATAGTSQTAQGVYGGAGGAGGAGSSGAAGTGGTAAASTAGNGEYTAARSLPYSVQGYGAGNSVGTLIPFRGGAGGGGGSGDGANSGGGGGGGGGVVIVNARTIASAITVQANGGAGFTPTTGNCGGGGGGGGGLVIVNTTSVTGGSSPTLQASGGGAGTGVGTGAAGTAGSTGRTYLNVFA